MPPKIELKDLSRPQLHGHPEAFSLFDTVHLFVSEGAPEAVWTERQPRANASPRSLREQREELALRAVAFRREVLGAVMGLSPGAVPFRIGPKGKPFIPHSNLAFNLSHSGPLLCLAVTAGTTLGVDLEIIRPRARLQELIGRCFSDDEQRHFEGLDAKARLQRFYVAWTLKEAYLKAIGQGLSLGLERVVLDPALHRFTALPVGQPDHYQSALGWIASTPLAVVYRGPLRRVQGWRCWASEGAPV